VIEIAIRLLAAVLIGGCIGIDREIRRKPAGMRTHALVSLGAALVMLIVVRTGPGVIEHVDAVSRAIQGIIAGVGFLGGGAILKSSEHDIVHGLTTAALIALALALLVLVVGEPIERLVHRIGYRKPPPDEEVQDFTRG